jgi:hypothetical protein
MVREFHHRYQMSDHYIAIDCVAARLFFFTVKRARSHACILLFCSIQRHGFIINERVAICACNLTHVTKQGSMLRPVSPMAFLDFHRKSSASISSRNTIRITAVRILNVPT